MIVQLITIHELAGIIAIKIFEVKVVYKIYPRGLLSRHYGIYLCCTYWILLGLKQNLDDFFLK